MLTYSATTVKEFKKELLTTDAYTEQRIGQAFFNYMEMHKVTSPENQGFLAKLYEADGREAWKLIDSHTDWAN